MAAAFEDMGVTPELIRAVEQKGWSLPTPVQADAVPLILGGGDVMAGGTLSERGIIVSSFQHNYHLYEAAARRVRLTLAPFAQPPRLAAVRQVPSRCRSYKSCMKR